MFPLSAFAFYFHYIYDEKGIIDSMKLDYKVNKVGGRYVQFLSIMNTFLTIVPGQSLTWTEVPDNAV
jgi:hypothetical protein